MKDVGKKWVVTALVVAVLVAGFAFLYASQERSQGPPEGFTTLSSEQLARMLETKDFFFVNVHVPYEGEIANTDGFVPYDKIADELDKMPADKDARIVLYCMSGRMSEIAARELVRLGYTNVSHLGGGMIEWERSGYDIIEKDAP